ncbi:MAG: ribokinase [Candidatus Abyssobacteria bacterium SURF_17]|uniref:Ribokinase n=1 Tax=Candidatus Abyssobacteria bacterium SURF_17 TaxID=2093361 RepID=A0A419F4T8_9BACT|nr:MAG: ribokinase [Candidatus Abyssubacteria bacterium SURF_17]
MAPERHIVVIGGMNMDLVCKAAVAPRPGETVVGESFYKGLGGKGANQAIMAARLGAPVSFVGRVGDDEFGREMLAAMRANGVSTDYMRVVDGCSSGIALIIVDAKAQNQIVVIPGANDRLEPKDITDAEELIAKSSLMVTQFESPLETVETAINVAAEHGVPVILNPAPVITQKISPSTLKKVQMLVPNETEAEALTGVKQDVPDFAMAAAGSLREIGVERVIVTLGDVGSVIADPQTLKRIPAYKVTPIDTTAAGDAFVGALAAGYFLFDELEMLARFASAAGALAVTKKGSQVSLPSRQDLERFLSQHDSALLSHFQHKPSDNNHDYSP